MNPWRGLGALPKEVWFLCLAILVNRAGTMVLPFSHFLTVEASFLPQARPLANCLRHRAIIVARWDDFQTVEQLLSEGPLFVR